MNLNDNALRVLESRYLIKNSDGKCIEAPHQLFERVANHISKAELKYGDPKQAGKWQRIFYGIMNDLFFCQIRQH